MPRLPWNSVLSLGVPTSLLGSALILASHATPPTVLQQIKDTGERVVATRNSPTTYYEGPQGPTGFEYDLVRLFADDLGVQLKIVSPPGVNAVLPLVAGRQVDLAAAGLVITSERSNMVRFGPVYDEISPQLVYRTGARAPEKLADLTDDTIEVATGSSHAEQLKLLAADHPEINWHENERADIDELLLKVLNREIDYTIANSNDVRLSQRFYPELRVAFDLAEPQPLAWAFPKHTDDSLINAAEAFFTRIRTNGQLDQLRERYYGHVQEFDYVGTARFLAHIRQRLASYQPNFVEAARRFELDWRLLAAIGYQESHWDPLATSPTGVRGIMMLTRTTASDLGITDRIDPDNSIRGGARYLRSIMRRIPQDIPDPDRTWMALAAYNMGPGHLEDARMITEARGGDPDKWMDIKGNIPLLMQKQWYTQTRHGYARGLEAIRYVESIRTYYDILVWRTDPHKSRAQLAVAAETPASGETLSAAGAAPVL